MNEFDFIRQLREQLKSRQDSPRLSVGIGDDAAVIRQYSDRDFVMTTDLLVEGVDFHSTGTSPRLLGHRALAVSLSDIAAMGARPRWTLVSFGFPPDVWNGNFREEFFAGYLSLAGHYGVALAGGDVSRSSQVVIDSIVVGEANTGHAVLRSTARPGDQIFVTGRLGGAAAGLKLLEMGAHLGHGERANISEPPAVAGQPIARQEADGKQREPALADRSEEEAIDSLLLRQLAPQARVGWGIVLGEEQLATAMIDISDGLSSDLHHMCEASSAGAIIDAASLPLDDDVVQLCGRRALDPLALALHGGEDFELLFTVAPKNVSRLPKFVDGVPIVHIGEITSQTTVRIREKNREWELRPGGFAHFHAASS